MTNLLEQCNNIRKKRCKIFEFNKTLFPWLDIKLEAKI